MSQVKHPDIGDTITGITTQQSHPREVRGIEVTGKICSIDPKPGGHPRCDYMYYGVKLDTQPNWVYILSNIPRIE